MFKYPRTAHLEGSRLQAGDEDLVVEEKLDGANAASASVRVLSFAFSRAQIVGLDARATVVAGAR